MKTFSLLTLAIAATFTLSSAKAQNKLSDNNFSQINFADGINIVMVDGTTPFIDTDNDNVTYTIDNDVLTLKASAGSETNAEVRICAPCLTAIQYHGDSDVNIFGNINTSKLLISASGNGDITFDSVTSRDLVCGVLGSGDIRLNHVKTHNAKCAIWSSGKVVMADETSDAVVANKSRLRINDCRYTVNPQDSSVRACYSLKNVNVNKTSNSYAAR
ncbi:MAG: GIN domain-containing protein [Muribaculaceae bacterium]